MTTPFVLIFDADNTLWDTNAVFQSAQLAILATFQKAGWIDQYEDRLEELRKVDRALMQKRQKNEYDFGDLVNALFHYYHNKSVDEAVKLALDKGQQNLDVKTRSILAEAKQQFFQMLEQPPALLPEVKEALEQIQSYRLGFGNIVTVLFSEGKAARLVSIMAAHRVKEQGFFDEIVIGKKTKDAFQRAADKGRKHLKAKEVKVVVIGDSLERDIQFANEAGFITVYIAGGFQGIERPECEAQRPTFQIQRMKQLLGILRELGISIFEPARWENK